MKPRHETHAQSMTPRWKPANGEHQLLFMGAANRALRGEPHPCPKCNGELRAYFHVFQPETGKGSLWVCVAPAVCTQLCHA